jgi:hypothetical protein
MKKGDSEHFFVGGREFQYSNANLGGSGLRSSKSFKVPLQNGLYVKLWHRHGIICRLDASTKLTSSLTPDGLRLNVAEAHTLPPYLSANPSQRP